MNNKQILESLEQHLSNFLYDIENEIAREQHFEALEIKRNLYSLTPTSNPEKHAYAQEKMNSLRLLSRVQAALNFIKNNREEV